MNGSQQLDPAELERLHYHVDNALHTRINLLLVAESIFLAALSQLWANGDFFMQVVLCTFGLLVTWVVRSSTETLARRTKWLAEERKKLDPTYKSYLESIPERPVQTKRLAAVLPILFLLGWMLLFVAVFTRHVLICLPK